MAVGCRRGGWWAKGEPLWHRVRAGRNYRIVFRISLKLAMGCSPCCGSGSATSF